jgi:hypothetical protein
VVSVLESRLLMIPLPRMGIYGRPLRIKPMRKY